MLVSQLITDTNAAYRGEETEPVFGTPEYTYWLGIANRLKNQWAKDPKQKWSSLFSKLPLEPGTVSTTGTTTLTGTGTNFLDYRIGDQVLVSGETVRTIDSISSDTVLTVSVAFSNTAPGETFTRNIIIATGVQEYNLNRNMYVPSDKTIVTDTNGVEVEYTLVHPQDREYVNQQTYIYGSNPKTLVFVDEILSTDQIVGGVLTVPGYFLQDDYTAETDVVDIDDPNWLTMALASELAFNDVTYEEKYVDLNAKANALYMEMIRANRQGTGNNPRSAKVNIKRIKGTGAGSF